MAESDEIKPKPKPNGWKEGILTREFKNSGSTLRVGEKVRYKRYKKIIWYDTVTGLRRSKTIDEYEWYYTNLQNTGLVRSDGFYIEN